MWASAVCADTLRLGSGQVVTGTVNRISGGIVEVRSQGRIFFYSLNSLPASEQRRLLAGLASDGTAFPPPVEASTSLRVRQNAPPPPAPSTRPPPAVSPPHVSAVTNVMANAATNAVTNIAAAKPAVLPSPRPPAATNISASGGSAPRSKADAPASPASLSAPPADPAVASVLNETLRHACASGMPDVVSALLESGADVNARGAAGETPLHLVVRASVRDARSAAEIVRILVAAKADVNAKDRNGDTPLHVAIENGAGETARRLIQANADVAATNAAGVTPLDIAETMPQRQELVEALRLSKPGLPPQNRARP